MPISEMRETQRKVFLYFMLNLREDTSDSDKFAKLELRGAQILVHLFASQLTSVPSLLGSWLLIPFVFVSPNFVSQ